jgi:hypothetical protein
MIERRLDEESGIIYVLGTGRWSLLDVDEHYDALRTMIEEVRKSGRRIRILSNVSHAERQDAEVEARILAHIRSTFQAGDRVAILTAETGDKLHVRQLLDGIEVMAFSSPIAAEIWLFVDEVRPD